MILATILSRLAEAVSENPIDLNPVGGAEIDYDAAKVVALRYIDGSILVFGSDKVISFNSEKHLQNALDVERDNE